MTNYDDCYEQQDPEAIGEQIAAIALFIFFVSCFAALGIAWACDWL